jgi:hypothetical protein
LAKLDLDWKILRVAFPVGVKEGDEYMQKRVKMVIHK